MTLNTVIETTKEDGRNCYWLTCYKFTINVVTNKNEIIIETAPIATKFIGQPLSNLIGWASKFGGFDIKKLQN